MPDTDGLYAALAAVQAELPRIAKDKQGKVEGTSKQGNAYSYTYDYAGLEDVTAVVLPLLGKHGLAFISKPTLSDGQFVLAYSLVHSGGSREDGEYPLPSSGTPQDIGKAITYARRYSLCAVTGVAPGGDDNDAQNLPSMHTDKRHRQEPAPPPRRQERPQQPAAAATDEGWGDWPSVIDAIASPEDAEAAKSEVDQAVTEGRMDDVKAAKIKRAMTIKGNTAARQGGAG